MAQHLRAGSIHARRCYATDWAHRQWSVDVGGV